jgi:hypothetical protein
MDKMLCGPRDGLGTVAPGSNSFGILNRKKMDPDVSKMTRKLFRQQTKIDLNCI